MPYRLMYRYLYLHFEVIFALCLHGIIKGYLESGSTTFFEMPVRVCTNADGGSAPDTVHISKQYECRR